MKLLIDAGNTRIKWALADNDEWLRSGVLPVEQADALPQQFAGVRRYPADLGQQCCRGKSRAAYSEYAKPAIPISSRRGKISVVCATVIPIQANCGSDRWAALIAAWHLVRRSCLVVNCGTAITIDTLSGQG